MIWLVVYVALLFGIGFHHWLRHREATLDGFVVYGRRAGGCDCPGGDGIQSCGGCTDDARPSVPCLFRGP